MKRFLLRICALILSVAMLFTICGCSGNSEKKQAGEYDLGYDMESFIDDFNDYLYQIVINSENAETTQTLYNSIKLSKERFISVDDEKMPYDYIEYNDSTSMLASMYCFKDPETGKYSEIAVWAPYSSYSGSLYSYFIFIVTSAAGACAAAGVDKDDNEMIVKANEMVGDICSTVKTSGSQSELVRFGNACFYASFSDINDGSDPRVFFYMLPKENCQNYEEYEAFAAKVEAENVEEETSAENG